MKSEFLIALGKLIKEKIHNVDIEYDRNLEIILNCHLICYITCKEVYYWPDKDRIDGGPLSYKAASTYKFNYDIANPEFNPDDLIIFIKALVNKLK